MRPTVLDASWGSFQAGVEHLAYLILLSILVVNSLLCTRFNLGGMDSSLPSPWVL
ncbi:hypothetical protein CCP3SC15_1300007 [Gammaproteobacteria bacterium]